MNAIHKFKDSLSSMGNSDAGSLIEASGSDATIRCFIARSGAIGCAVSVIECTTDSPAPRTSEALKHSANQLAEKLTYLIEPVRLIEFDENAESGHLRSAPPSAEDSTRSYFEISLSNGEISLRRYEKSPGSSRVSVPADFTREVLIRVTSDLVHALNAE